MQVANVPSLHVVNVEGIQTGYEIERAVKGACQPQLVTGLLPVVEVVHV